jgi:hypothetical protein
MKKRKGEGIKQRQGEGVLRVFLSSLFPYPLSVIKIKKEKGGIVENGGKK